MFLDAEISTPTPETQLGIDALLATLPPLPTGWLRLTHFTSEWSADNVLKTKFYYEKSGILGSTTDPFSEGSMAEFKVLLETGKAGVFDRRAKGNCILIMDLEASEHKKRLLYNFEHVDDGLPNSNIVGYVKLLVDAVGNQTYVFKKNPHYKPVVTELTKRPIMIFGREVTPSIAQNDRITDREVSTPTNTDLDDIW